MGKRTFEETSKTKALGIHLKEHLKEFDTSGVILTSQDPIPKMKELITLLNSEDVKIQLFKYMHDA